MLRHSARKTPLWAIAIAGAVSATTSRRTSHPSNLSVARERRLVNNTAGPSEKPRSDGGRGRHADTPTDIPARGWKDIAYRIYRGISEDRIVAISAGVTFF